MNIWRYRVIRVYEKVKTFLIRNFYKIRYGVKYVPWILQVEPTVKCQANCVFCPREYALKLPDLDIELFKRIIDAVPFITQVHTQGFGDPLLYPHLPELVRYANNKGKRVVFYTNAAALTDELSIKVLESGLGQIRFSVDDCVKEKYEMIRPPLKWERVLGNIERFQKLRDVGGYKTTTVIAICVTEINKNRLLEIIDFWEKRVDMVACNPEVYVPRPKDFEGKEVYDKESGEQKICKDVKDSLIIKGNGKMLLCCQDLYHMHSQGNIFDLEKLDSKSLLSLYNGEKFNATREAMKSGKSTPIRCKFCGTC